MDEKTLDGLLELIEALIDKKLDADLESTIRFSELKESFIKDFIENNENE